jgi:hypothetical protein
MFFCEIWGLLLTKLLIRLMDRENKQVGEVEMDDLKRRAGQAYQRRSVILRGKKFMEPEPEALEFAPADEWHEV